VQFNHTIGYDSAELVGNYELSHGRAIYMEHDITKQYGGSFVS
jgi:hypothetical protein